YAITMRSWVIWAGCWGDLGYGFEDERDPLTAANTHRDETITLLFPAQCVSAGQGQNGARCTEGVTQCDGSSGGIHLFRVDTELGEIAHHSQCLRRERLVQLNSINGASDNACGGERALGRGNWAPAHHTRIACGDPHPGNAGERFNAALFHIFFAPN